jgi:hypothetical protein
MYLETEEKKDAIVIDVKAEMIALWKEAFTNLEFVKANKIKTENYKLDNVKQIYYKRKTIRIAKNVGVCMIFQFSATGPDKRAEYSEVLTTQEFDELFELYEIYS